MSTLRRTATLTALLIGATFLGPTGASAIETCGRQAATIIGTGPHVQGTEGRDVIVSGAAARVDGGGGDDLICVQGDGRQPSFVTVEGGSGNDTIHNTIQTGTVDVDAAGSASLNGSPWLRWSGFEGLELSVVGNAALTVTGTPADDSIFVSTGFVDSTISAELGAGDDHLTVWAYDQPGLGDVHAGSGRDTVEVVGITSVKADLRLQTLRWGADTHELTASRTCRLTERPCASSATSSATSCKRADARCARTVVPAPTRWNGAAVNPKAPSSPSVPATFASTAALDETGSRDHAETTSCVAGPATIS